MQESTDDILGDMKDTLDEVIAEKSDMIPDELVGLFNGDSEAAVNTLTDLISDVISTTTTDEISTTTTDEISTTTTLKTKQEE